MNNLLSKIKMFCLTLQINRFISNAKLFSIDAYFKFFLDSCKEIGHMVKEEDHFHGNKNIRPSR
jgi:small nuclear ribonucleoprotein (snRNP)-like protein